MKYYSTFQQLLPSEVCASRSRDVPGHHRDADRCVQGWRDACAEHRADAMRFDSALQRVGHVSLEAVGENRGGSQDGVILQPRSPRSAKSLHSVLSKGSSLH